MNQFVHPLHLSPCTLAEFSVYSNIQVLSPDGNEENAVSSLRPDKTTRLFKLLNKLDHNLGCTAHLLHQLDKANDPQILED